MRTLFGEGVGVNVAFDFSLSAALPEELGELRVVGRIVEVRGHPLDAKVGVGGGAIVGAGARMYETVDNTLNVLPQIVVGMGGWGAAALEDLVELRDNGFVV